MLPIAAKIFADYHALKMILPPKEFAKEYSKKGHELRQIKRTGIDYYRWLTRIKDHAMLTTRRELIKLAILNRWKRMTMPEKNSEAGCIQWVASRTGVPVSKFELDLFEYHHRLKLSANDGLRQQVVFEKRLAYKPKSPLNSDQTLMCIYCDASFRLFNSKGLRQNLRAKHNKNGKVKSAFGTGISSNRTRKIRNLE
ncbi:hypothetical protein M422DRAFT_248446 [Sphaerobolus stellatus SS14]|uniref:Uncharacterized protein n=1 Tax=Sphaerobolus stellatus (strain SS14) TaxID=990650 RepID=A0A0C9VIS3_SPHS4|nr:hypothetical protein M422DRAFT_248446 [Sphaerobolus stellatus SS14]